MKKPALLVLALIAFSACKKEKTTMLSTTSTKDYYPMSVGSYWIYERTQIDTNGVETPTLQPNDSVYVSRDTVINGETYAVFVGAMWWSPMQESYMRDSAGYILSSSGSVLDLTNLYGILDFQHDSAHMWNVTTYVEHPSDPITVPAGTFSVLDRVRRVDFLDPNYYWDSSRYMHDYYAKGVGLVREIAFYYLASWCESRRLLRYHIE